MAQIVCITLNPALDLAFNLETLTPGQVNRPDSVQLEAAGKGVNVARVLASLGHEVIVSGFLGQDNDAPFSLAFPHYGVEDAFVRVPGSTRINAKLAEKSGRVTDINGPGMPIAPVHLDALRQTLGNLFQRTSPPQAIVVAGSLPPGFDQACFVQLLASLKSYGVPLWIDTSGPALLTAIAAGPSAVKPNETELADWAGGTLHSHQQRQAAAQRLHASGIEHALISAGAEGVLWVSSQGIWQSTPPGVNATNTVCAGDTFVAGMLHGLLSGFTPHDTLRFATALSAEAVRHIGVGNPYADDFDLLQQQTLVRRLDDVITEGATR
jgi:1-phosphofructokinase